MQWYNSIMDITKKIQGNKLEIEKFSNENAINFIGLFGSYARGEENNDSDLDLLVKFDFSKKNIGMFELFKLQKTLENMFGKKVDIVTNPNKLFQPYIEKDLKIIYERR